MRESADPKEQLIADLKERLVRLEIINSLRNPVSFTVTDEHPYRIDAGDAVGNDSDTPFTFTVTRSGVTASRSGTISLPAGANLRAENGKMKARGREVGTSLTSENPGLMRTVVFILTVLLLGQGASAEAPFVGDVRVVDGDTIRFTTRLMGFDTPEIGFVRSASKN
jgi:hypothetical protein